MTGRTRERTRAAGGWRRPAACVLGALLAAGTPTGHAETLLDFYDAALATNPTYRIRELSIDQARGQRSQTFSRLLPQISANSNYSQNNFDDPFTADHYNGTRNAVQLRQALLDLTGYFRFSSAKSAVLQTKYARDAVRMELAGEVIDRYLLVLQAADEVNYLGAEQAATESDMKRLRAMRERQLVKITDLLEVEAYYQELLTNAIQAHNNHAVALAQLRESSGIDVSDVAPLTRIDFTLPQGDEASWVATALRNNGTLLALQQAIEAAHALLRSAQSEHLPTVALTATQVRSDQGVDNRQSPRFDVGSVGVQMSLSLYEGGRISGDIAEAKARWKIARQQYEQAARQIERETRTALLESQSSFARVHSTGEQVAALERVVDAQRKSYSLGVATVIDLLVAERRLLRARSDQSRARYDFIRNASLLRVRAGNLARADITEIDQRMRQGPPAPPVKSPQRPPLAPPLAPPVKGGPSTARGPGWIEQVAPEG